MKKQIIYFALLLCCSFMLFACDKDNNQEVKDIRLGVEDVNEVSLNKLSTRMILLTGGTGKYTVNVADSKIASASISKDTLRISEYSKETPMQRSFQAILRNEWLSMW